MTNTFQPLECDTDILMIGKDTFTVERFKELAKEKLIYSFEPNYSSDHSMFDCLSNSTIDISVEFNLKNIELIFPPEGMECKILKLGNSEWQTGKIRICVLVIGASEIKVIKLEFCYDELL
ncbi:MAG: KGK domain-containing protein [Trichodesmium sp. MO_231.B1]|nr:KGK domain-containing protein [Trichodesmium sp. MO_231.B1]